MKEKVFFLLLHHPMKVSALRSLKAAKEDLAQRRRTVVVLGVGATSVMGAPGVSHCFSETLPAAIHSLALAWPPRSHHLVEDSPLCYFTRIFF